MTKLYANNCCRVNGLPVEVDRPEKKVVFSIPTLMLKSHYDTYRKSHTAPKSSELTWSVRFLSPRAVEADTAMFNINDDAAEICYLPSNETISRATLEVRGVAEDKKKSLWFVGIGTSERKDKQTQRRRGQDFYDVFTSLDGRAIPNSSRVFGVSSEDQPEDIVRIELRKDLVGYLTNSDANASNDLRNDLQVLATAMAFQPLFMEVLLNGNENQHARIIGWLNKARPEVMKDFHNHSMLVNKEVKGSTNLREVIGKLVEFSHELAGYALDDFTVRSTTRDRKKNTEKYTHWLRKNSDAL